jgi:hypothetical protein
MVAENQGVSEVSDRKREANRRNAQKSTGPRTDGGKLHSRLNAMNHGMYASDSCLIGDESHVEFQTFRFQLLARLDPRDDLELVICERIVIGHWRLKRVAACENEIVKEIHHNFVHKSREGIPHYCGNIAELEKYSEMEDSELAKSLLALVPAIGMPATLVWDLEKSNSVLLRLQNYEQKIERSIARWMRELRLLRTPIKGAVQHDEPSPYIPHTQEELDTVLKYARRHDKLREYLNRPETSGVDKNEGNEATDLSGLSDQEPMTGLKSAKEEERDVASDG